MKPKKTQPQTPKEPQGRDLFLTPAYAVKMLIPFLPIGATIYDPADGTSDESESMGKIVQEIIDLGYGDFVAFGTDIRNEGIDFLEYELYSLPPFDIIVTNPPYSLKRKFYEKCLSTGKRFALLIPFDASLWTLLAVRDAGCQWIIPTRRVDYITPSGKSGKASSANFHSGWLTYGFNLPCQMNIIDLSLEDKKNV